MQLGLIHKGHSNKTFIIMTLCFGHVYIFLMGLSYYHKPGGIMKEINGTVPLGTKIDKVHCG